jgi:hypothetical protein
MVSDSLDINRPATDFDATRDALRLITTPGCHLSQFREEFRYCGPWHRDRCATVRTALIAPPSTSTMFVAAASSPRIAAPAPPIAAHLAINPRSLHVGADAQI